MPKLPVELILPQLERALAKQNTLLIAPPGAGKTTTVPLALLNAVWLSGKRIIMLEPRRLAARNAAFWMAHQLKERVGETVGYRTRHDSKIGANTRIEVVTEGILTRIIQDNPELESYGLIIFDEFHERNLSSDLGFALSFDIQQNLRDDIRILIMSATLQVESIIQKFPDMAVLKSEGRSFPVDIYYLGEDRTLTLEQHTSKQIAKIIDHQPGSLLVFLPGSKEIQRVAQQLHMLIQDTHIQIYPLYGSLSLEQQQAAIEPCTPESRKIVLATNLAETSLTIEGIRLVIDTGFMRSTVFDKKSGMSRLELQRISRASAEQRCGRAGRTSEGICYRLWNENSQQGMVPFSTPEILVADLADLVLELALWGVKHPKELRWLDAPPESHFNQAQELLKSLNALDKQARITAHGKQMSQLGLTPRLAHMLLSAKSYHQLLQACYIAALLTERDILHFPMDQNNVDFRLRLEALQQPQEFQDMMNKNTFHRISENISQLIKKTSCKKTDFIDAELCGVLIAQAYPERIAQHRGASNNRYLLSNGKGAFINEQDALAREKYLAIASLDGKNQEAKIFLAAPITEQQLAEYFSDQIHCIEKLTWLSNEKAVSARQQTCLGAIILDDQPAATVDRQKIFQTFLNGLSQEDVKLLPWTQELRQWQARVQFLRQWPVASNLPAMDDASLKQTYSDWLSPFLMGKSRLSQISQQELNQALRSRLDWQQQQLLEQMTPTHFVVPSGSRIAINYCHGDVPILAVRLQEMFGCAKTPSILDGHYALMLHLLSPAHRPVQITRDINSFWANSYDSVKKDMKGRYPKHYWPDNPLQAEATHRGKPRK